MSDTIVQILFSSSYWLGGSGDLSSNNWGIGYYLDETTGQETSIITGSSSGSVVFASTLPDPLSTPTTGGGTLTGVMDADGVGIERGYTYDLAGTISAEFFSLGGMLGTSAPFFIDFSGRIFTVSGLGSGSNSETVVNDGSIEATGTSGRGVSLGSGSSVTNAASGLIVGSYYGVEMLSGTVVNEGSIADTGTNGAGVFLILGGSVSNESFASISGYRNGVRLENAGTVVNDGRIASTGVNGAGIDLDSGGLVTNAATASIIGSVFGIEVGIGTVVNYGSIAAIAASGNGGVGIYLFFGGSVTNAASASITGSGNGVEGHAVTVTNNGSIAGTGITFSGGIRNGDGIFLSGSGLVMNAASASITGGADGVYLSGGGFVTNASSASIRGGIAGIGLSGGGFVTNASSASIMGGITGVYLSGGGLVTNAASASITGGAVGVAFTDVAGTVVNNGSIAGNITSVSGAGVILRADGTVTNQNGATIVGYVGISNGGGAGVLTVVNDGSIVGNTTSVNGRGIDLVGGGRITNQSGGAISGNEGIFGGINGGALTVVNFGIITGNPTSGVGVFPMVNSSVTNQSTATISGADGIFSDGIVTVVNAGSIEGTGAGTTSIGVFSLGGGSVTNQNASLINDNNGKGVYIVGGAGTVLNAGIIMTSGGTSSALGLRKGGYVNNALTGTISSFGGAGVYVSGAAGTVINAGSIAPGGTHGAVDLFMGGLVSNAGAGTINAGAGIGVDIKGGSGTLNNAGVITRSGSAESAVDLLNGGFVGNAGNGTISSNAHSAIYVTGGAGTVVNAGTIAGSFSSVHFSLGGSITNQSTGTISGDTYGIYVTGAAAAVINAGELLSSSSFGVDLKTGGSITNQTTGTISGGGGIYIGGSAGTVVNDGSIVGSGGTAVGLAPGFVNRVMVDPGAAFTGNVAGGNAIGATEVSTLELASGASYGTLSGLGTEFINFGQLMVDADSNWMLTGDNTIATGETLTNSGTLDIEGDVTGTGVTQIENNATLELGGSFAAGGTVSFAGTGPATLILDDPEDFQGTITGLTAGDIIDLPDVSYNSGASATFLENNNILQVAENGSTYTLQLDRSQTFSGGFQLSQDSLGGMHIELSPKAVKGYSTSASPDPPVASPYYGVVYIQDAMPDQASSGFPYTIGTGFIIGPHSILTAAHVVEDSVGPAAVSSIQVFPGYTSGGGYSSYGVTSVVPDPNFVPINNATSELPAIPSNSQYDFAVINVSTDLTSYGMFGMQAYYSSGTVNLTGYPSNSQYNDFGSLVADFAYNLLDYSLVNGIVSSPGYSGGPLWTYDGTTPTAVGICVTNNYGVQFTASDISNILSWEVTGTPCYAAGTRILASRGMVAAEDLRIGDLVQTMLDGKLRPIIWIGHRHVDCARHPKPRTVWPVRVSVGAIGPGRPHTDLFLSPDHSIYINGVLIPVKHLINDSTISQVRVAQVNYYHIELPRHEVVLAEGLPAESYLDTGDRSNFANGSGPIALYPDFTSRIWEAQGCAPLVVAGPEVEGVRRKMATLAARLSRRKAA